MCGRVVSMNLFLPLSSQDVYLPHTLACILATVFTWAAVAAGRGRAAPAQALTAPGEPAQSSIRGSVAGPGPPRVSLPFPPSGSGPAHRKWLSTVSFFASLESPVMNRVRLTCRRNTPGRKVTRASQSARGTPCSSLLKEDGGDSEAQVLAFPA